MSFSGPEFWVALSQVIGLNCVLSVDNAVAIALVARRLPAGQQIRAFAWGGGAAIAMRIVLTIGAVELLRLPYLKLAGAMLLLWVAVQLLQPEHASGAPGAMPRATLASAIKTIVLADLVMSLDNVIAVAAAARGSTELLIVGLAISIPLVVLASRLLLTLMSRHPIIVAIGAALIGWVAGEMAITDPALKSWVDAHATYLQHGAPALGAVAVLWLGKSLAARSAASQRVAPP